MTLRKLLPPELSGLDYLIGKLGPSGTSIHFWIKTPVRGRRSLFRPTEASRYALCGYHNDFYPERVIYDAEGEICTLCLRKAGLQ